MLNDPSYVTSLQIELVETDIYRTSRMRDAMARTEPDRCSIYVQHVASLQKELDVIYDNLNAPFRRRAEAQKHFESNRCTKYYFKQNGKHNNSVKCLSGLNGNK